MKAVERIPIFIDIVDGETKCLCPRWAKRCNRKCDKDYLYRDRFAGWEETMKRDKFGKSKT